MKLDTIYCGDNVQIMQSFPDECIDLTVTSPPYDLVDWKDGVLTTFPEKGLRDYEGYNWDFVAVAEQLYRVTKQGGVVIWVVGDKTENGSESGSSFRQALYFKEIGFNMETMIYQVPGTGAKGSNNYYWQVFEYMFVCSKGKPKTVNRLKDKRNRRAGSVSTSGAKQRSVGTRLHGIGGTIVGQYGYRDNVWTILPGNNGDDATNHPAPFPEALARDHILSWSNPNDAVLDCFCGSGTTLKMAIETGRHYTGIDISEEYVALSKKRVQGARTPLFVI